MEKKNACLLSSSTSSSWFVTTKTVRQNKRTRSEQTLSAKHCRLLSASPPVFVPHTHSLSLYLSLSLALSLSILFSFFVSLLLSIFSLALVVPLPRSDSLSLPFVCTLAAPCESSFFFLSGRGRRTGGKGRRTRKRGSEGTKRVEER